MRAGRSKEDADGTGDLDGTGAGDGQSLDPAGYQLGRRLRGRRRGPGAVRVAVIAVARARVRVRNQRRPNEPRVVPGRFRAWVLVPRWHHHRVPHGYPERWERHPARVVAV